VTSRVGPYLLAAVLVCLFVAGLLLGGGPEPAATSAQSAPAQPAPPTGAPSPVPPTVAAPTPGPTTAPVATATPTAASTALPISDGAQRQAAIPILMYHHVSDPPPDADEYRRDLSAPPAVFEQHLAYLRDQGYQSITLEQLLRHLESGEPLPDRPVIITFDDGYLDNFTNALPLLQRYGFSGVYFVVTELAERASLGMAAPDGLVYADEYMTWEQLRQAIAAGLDVQCHARAHEDLTGMDDERLMWHVLGCREMLESRLGRRPRFVAYPSGFYDERVVAAFAADGYWGGVTTHQGVLQRSDAPFELARLRMRSHTTVEELAALLTMDWPQQP
jgi:peptidoglycan/xylan/chitin deacetylase (PgdA/CDA1 family)